MRKKDPVKALRRWLKKPDNFATSLASKLGYKSSSTISAWLKKEKIPTRIVNQMMEEIGE